MLSYFTLLNKLTTNKFNQREINFAVESSVKIAVCYVLHASKRIKKAVIGEELRVEDIAIDSIAPLFEKNHEGVFFRFEEAFHKWSPPVSSEAEALFFINKLIASRVDQHIAYMLKTSDPIFSQIHDSIKYYIKKSGYCKINYLGSVFIVESENPGTGKSVICPADFERLPFFLFENNKNVLTELFNYLKSETDFLPAIPFNALISRLKSFYMNELTNKNQPAQFNIKMETLEFIKLGLEKAAEKLDSFYVKKGKLNKAEADAFVKALNSMAEDISSGGLSPGLYKYLRSHMKGLSKEEYHSRYHYILEYLVKVMKATIAQKINA